MKNYIVYLPSGEIIKTGQSQDSVFNMQGEYVIEGVADDNLQYVSNGKIVDMPPRPDGEAYFNYETKKWDLDYLGQKELVSSKKNDLLYKSDWTQIPNNPLTQEQQQAWTVYRQQLRDVTSQSGYPFNVVWPIQPE